MSTSEDAKEDSAPYAADQEASFSARHTIPKNVLLQPSPTRSLPAPPRSKSPKSSVVLDSPPAQTTDRTSSSSTSSASAPLPSKPAIAAEELPRATRTPDVIPEAQSVSPQGATLLVQEVDLDEEEDPEFDKLLQYLDQSTNAPGEIDKHRTARGLGPLAGTSIPKPEAVKNERISGGTEEKRNSVFDRFSKGVEDFTKQILESTELTGVPANPVNNATVVAPAQATAAPSVSSVNPAPVPADNFSKTVGTFGRSAQRMAGRPLFEKNDDMNDESIKLQIHQEYNRIKGETLEQFGDVPSWGEKLIYSMDVVKEQLKQGSKVCKFVEKFLERYIKLQLSFAQQMGKFFDEENSRLDGFDMPDLMGTLWHTMRNVVAQIHTIGTMHEEHAQEVRSTILRKVKIVSQQYDQRVDQVNSDYRKVNDSFRQAKLSLQKKHDQCVRLINISEAPTENLSFFNKAALAAQSLSFSKEDPKEKSYQAAVDYEESIEQTNAFMKRLTTKTHPKILEDMQDLEQFRHILLVNSLEDFGRSFHPLGVSYSSLTKSTLGFLDVADLKKDLENVIKNCNIKIDQAKYTFSFDLPFTVHELGKTVNPAFKKKCGMGVFNSTNIQQVMDVQKEMIPGLKLPLCFVQLRSLLRRLQFETFEGIFRLSPAESILQDFVEKLKHGELDSKTIDPHVPATALKQWIRSIDPPLIPFELYDEFTGKGASLKGPDLLSLIDKTPEDNKALIHSLVHLLQTVSSPQNVRITKMDISNLAVCFAPVLLRGGGENTVEFMTRAKDEQAFCSNLFTNLVVDESLLQLDMDSLVSAEGVLERKT